MSCDLGRSGSRPIRRTHRRPLALCWRIARYPTGKRRAPTERFTASITEVFKPVISYPNTTVGLEGCGEYKVLSADKQLDADVKFLSGY